MFTEKIIPAFIGILRESRSYRHCDEQTGTKSPVTIRQAQTATQSVGAK
jgi:hypothetical protein